MAVDLFAGIPVNDYPAALAWCTPSRDSPSAIARPMPCSARYEHDSAGEGPCTLFEGLDMIAPAFDGAGVAVR